MSKASQALKKTIWQKLAKLPARKQAEVLSQKRIKKLSLSKIAAIVHEVRHAHASARSL